jgi:hypothetical protein
LASQSRHGTSRVVLPCSIDGFTLLVVASFLESLPVSLPTASSCHVCAPPDTGCGGASDAGGADTEAGEPEQRAGERWLCAVVGERPRRVSCAAFVCDSLTRVHSLQKLKLRQEYLGFGGAESASRRVLPRLLCGVQ